MKRRSAQERRPPFAAGRTTKGALVGIVASAWILFGILPLPAADAWTPVDSQHPSERPLPPDEAIGKLHVPAGFRITLAAAEPGVRQPIAIAYDERGRLWVAESYSYNGSDFTDDKHDRILIFEDADGDGVFESRRIFHDRLNRLTGLNVGFGGVWITSPPNVAFIPDRDRDDRPDREPIVLLDGWTLKAEHNSVNGLSWGPDGWLYGRHGNKQTSLVGKPGDSKEQRVSLSCAIWRYHPLERRFEVVADGTVNPWGLDFDDYGQGFLSTSVIEHLWHLAPGARYERGFGRAAHPNPHSYELMETTAAHLHWGGSSFEKSTRVAEGNAAFGGGHAHSDAMIYLGDRWPAEYRGSVFLSNIHGRRINRDYIDQEKGHGRYLARHAPDFLTADDKWFRAVSLAYGPDGDVIMTDWSDTGECHDRDGVHRSSGRIYKISWGPPRRVNVNLATEPDRQLVELQLHRNDWHVRQARRLLQERAATGADMAPTHAALRRMFASQDDVTRKLRALWALNVTGGANSEWLMDLFAHPNEHVRWWAVRLATERNVDASVAERLADLARKESTWLVRTGLASALGRIDPARRMVLAAALVEQCPAEVDANLARLIWYGLEPLVAAAPASAGSLAVSAKVPRLRRFLARRLAEELGPQPAAGDALIAALERITDPGAARDVLKGALEGLAGMRDVPVPSRAHVVLARWRQAEDQETSQLALRLAANLGDTSTAGPLRGQMNDSGHSVSTRLAALDALARSRPHWLVDDLLQLLRTPALAEAVIRALAAFSDARVARALLAAYPSLALPGRAAAIDVLAGRADTSHLLLDALAEQRLKRADISAAQARQMAQLGDPKLTAKLETGWGRIKSSSSEIKAAIRRARGILTPAALGAANLAAGQSLFDQRCATCHRLFDRGGLIGPDLTGSGRKDLEYLLPNIIDPNAVIPADYQLCVITTRQGRVLSGTMVEAERSIVVQTFTERLTIDRDDIKDVQRLHVSLMPNGLLESLTSEETRDLVAYLMSDGIADRPPGRVGGRLHPTSVTESIRHPNP